MMRWIAKASTPPRARATGTVYLLYFLTAILAQFLVGRGLVIMGNVTNIIAVVFYSAVTLLFYGMFKPVNRVLSLLGALFSLVGCAVMTLSFFHLPAWNASPLMFFGPYCLVIGFLIFLSTFLPRILGVLMALAGLGWLAVLTPAPAHPLTVGIQVLGILAEGSLMLWLVIMGVDDARWREQAGQEQRRQLSTQRSQWRRSKGPLATSTTQFDPFAASDETE